MAAPKIVRMRPVDGQFVGTTAFFRNRAFISRFAAEIAATAPADRPADILVHACSIGAEVYSLALQLRIAHPSVDFRIQATDISPRFVQFAERGVYPKSALGGLTPEEKDYFDPLPSGDFAVGLQIRARMHFGPSGSFVDYAPGRMFDAVSVCNAMIYVTAEDQARALDRIAGYNRSVLAVTGGHASTIEADLVRNGYVAAMDGFDDVHAGWTDRQRGPNWRPDAEFAPHIHADPFLAPLDREPGWRYRHGTIFKKRSLAIAA